MKIRIPFLLFIYFFSLTLWAQDVDIPKLNSRVTDLTGTLSSSEQATLEQKLKGFESEKGSQVVVVLIPTTGDESIEQYSIRLAEKWKIGRGGADDGVIMLFAMQDRKMRIEVGYGLEGALTDALSKRIITNVITPDFRSGNFYRGIDHGVDVVISAISGESLPPVVTKTSTSSNRNDSSPIGGLIFPLMVFVFIAIAVLKSILGKKFGKGKVAIITAAVVFILCWVLINVAAAIFITIIMTIFTSLPGGRGGRGGGMYMGGGFGGGYSGGGFSGGGFSGGGGGFGGGGASGGW